MIRTWFRISIGEKRLQVKNEKDLSVAVSTNTNAIGFVTSSLRARSVPGGRESLGERACFRIPELGSNLRLYEIASFHSQ